MPKLTLHPLSVLAGVALTGLVLLTSSQSPLLPTGFRIEYLPHPRDMVQIKEGTPYTVPAGKLFVLNSLGSVEFNAQTFVYLRVNGQPEVRIGPELYGTRAFTPLGGGFTAQAGDSIEVAIGPGSSGAQARAWGYLAGQ